MKPFAGAQTLIAIVAVLAACARTLAAGANVWTSLGPEGGSIERLLVDPRSPSTLYAVAGGGVFKTANSGRTWSLAISGLRTANVSTLAIDPQNPSTLYTVAGNLGFKSIDGGMTWSELYSFPAHAYALAVDRRSGTVYARTCGGVARSTDGGESWSETVFPLPLSCSSVFAIDPDGALYTTRLSYTASGHGTDRIGTIFKSADGGESWSILELGVTSVGVFALAIDPQDSSTMYALARGSLLPTGGRYGTWVFKTTDGGASWINATAVAGAGGVVAVDPQNPNTVYAATRSAVLRSTDGGASWNPFALQLVDGTQWDWSPSSVTALAIAPAASPSDPVGSSMIYAGTSTRGVWKSADEGSTWATVNSGLIATNVSAVLIDPESPATIYSVLGGVEIVKSSDGGANWRSADSGLPGSSWLGSLAIDPRNPAAVYVGTSWRGVFKTTDGGTGWQPANAGLPGEVNSLAIDNQNGSTLYVGAGDEACWEYGRCGSSGVFKSVDGGASWSRSGLSDFWVGRVVVDPQNSNAINATGFLPRSAGGAPGAWGWGSPSFFKSTDGGQSWDVLSLPVPSINGLAIDPREPSTAYAYGESLIKTVDGGRSWNAVDLASVRTLAIDPQTPSTLYAGTDSGVFRSTDKGASWEAVNSGLQSLSINTLMIDPRNPSTVYAGTSGGGVFSITFTSQGQ